MRFTKKILNSDTRIKGQDVNVVSEGILAPNTYSFDMKISKKQLLDIIKKQQEKIVQMAWDNRERDLPLKTPNSKVLLF